MWGIKMNRLEMTLALRQVMAEAMAVISDLYEHNLLMGEAIKSDRSKHLMIHLDEKVHQIKKQYDQLRSYHHETTNR